MSNSIRNVLRQTSVSFNLLTENMYVIRKLMFATFYLLFLIGEFSLVLANKSLKNSSTIGEKPFLHVEREDKKQSRPEMLNVSDERVYHFVKEGLRTYRENYKDSLLQPVVAAINGAIVVNAAKGLYKIYVTFGQSTCIPIEIKRLDVDCYVIPSGQFEECLITARFLPWIKEGNTEIKLKCYKKKERATGYQPAYVLKESVISYLLDVSHPKVHDYVRKGFQKYSKNVLKSCEPVIAEINSASVSSSVGKLYNISVKLGVRNCWADKRSLAKLKLEDCVITLSSDHGRVEPDFKVSVDCSINNRKTTVDVVPSAIKADTHLDVTVSSVMQYVQKGLKKYSKTLRNSYQPLVAEINGATLNSLVGHLYKISVTFAESDCVKKTTQIPEVRCNIIPEGESQQCLITVYHRTWVIHQLHEITLNCGKKKERVRQILASSGRTRPNYLFRLSVTKPIIRKYARNGLLKYAQRFTESCNLIIDEIKDAYVIISDDKERFYSIRVTLQTTCFQESEDERKLIPEMRKEDCYIRVSRKFKTDKSNSRLLVDCKPSKWK